MSNVIDNNGNYSGVDPEYNDESDENDALIPPYNSENSSGDDDDDDDSDDFIFQENDEDDYLNADAFEYFVTRTDDPNFIHILMEGIMILMLTMISMVML